jgi:hypothetical protein
MIKSTRSHGMVPSDILIRGAIMAGLDDLRKNSFLLDYIFMWYANDDLTNKTYGEAERQRAKKWFLNTEIFVSMNYRADDVKFPLVSIGLQSSTEDFATLGDVNYETQEDVPSEEISATPEILMGPFTPKSYDSTTGTVTLPDNLDTGNIFVNTILVDVVNGNGYPVIQVNEGSTFKIASGVTANFTNAFIAPIDSFYVAQLESCLFKQTFSIKLFAQNDPLYVLYLQSIIESILMRYKETLLEARGFDRSTHSVGPLYNYSETDKDMVWARDITLSGYVRQYWPKMISPKIQGIKIHGIEILGGSVTPSGLLSLVNSQGWGMEGDFDAIGAS